MVSFTQPYLISYKAKYIILLNAIFKPSSRKNLVHHHIQLSSRPSSLYDSNFSVEIPVINLDKILLGNNKTTNNHKKHVLEKV